MIKTSLFADQEREAKLNHLGDALQVMEQHVDFASLATEVDLAAPRPTRERGSRPPFPTELMVRVLLIQLLFDLSDERMEFQLLDRLSFQRFVGLRASSQIPDRTMIWTFKERLIQAVADKRYKLVRKIKVSTASEHDTTHFEDVLDPTNTNRDILADKGYVDGEREARLSKQGWRMHIQRKGSKDKLISEARQRRNHRIAKTRARIEHVVAGLAQMGGKTLCSIGLARARLNLNWKVAAYNLQCLVYLKEAGIEAF